MKAVVYFKLALKYLWRHKRRYLFMFIALGFGFGVQMVISSLKDGMKENLYVSAQAHYSGDIIAFGLDPDTSISYHMTSIEIDSVLASAQAASIDPLAVSVRTAVFGMRRGSIHFNGNTSPLKDIVGVDWEAEKKYIGGLSFTGSPSPFNDDTILLSRPVAEELMIQQGDSIILEVLTVTGQKNTGTFFVDGIVDDSAIFGFYKVYVSRLTLNRLIGLADGDCSYVGFSLKNRKTLEQKRAALYNSLLEKVKTLPLVSDRDGFYKSKKNLEKGISVLLISLPVLLSEVDQLVSAIDLAAFVLFAMMMAIIMVSAAVTCRLILHERTRETGTMRAIGFYDRDLRRILFMEMASMAFLSMAAGFLLSLLINRGFRAMSYSWFPGFEVFLHNGQLIARYLPGTIVVNIVVTASMLTLAIGGQIFRNSRGPLGEMLSGGAM